LKITVALSCNIFEPLTYQVKTDAPDLEIGMRVLVPLGKRIVSGWVIGLDSSYPGRLKNIVGLIDDPYRPDEAFLEFVRQGAVAYFASVGVLLDHSLPASKKDLKKLYLEADGRAIKMSSFTLEQLEKMAAIRTLRFSFKKRTEERTEFAVSAAGGASASDRLLLDPDRESDYREVSRAVMAGGQSVLLLVPDNASARFWKTVWPELDIYNSETRAAAKENIWLQYYQGKNGMVCGGISAALLPMANLGLLIVDRASSPLFQRTFRSPFKTDHLARIRARAEGIPILLGAAGHSCATYLPPDNMVVADRRPDRGLSLHVHMLKGRDRGIPDAIIQLINQNYLNKKKTLVLVNKVEPALSLFCPTCGKIAVCPSCGGILQVDDPHRAACRRCSFRQEDLAACPRCQGSLTLLHDISLTSLARAIERGVGEQSVLTLSATELKDMERIIPAVKASAVVIATPAALNPFFRDVFSTVVYIKPESFFGMDEFNSAEMIFTTAAEIMETMTREGELHVFSVFHFHYALQFLMDEARFFERELKYRQWFALPPFSDVYQLEVRDGTLRALAAVMRDLYRKYKGDLQIKKIYLASRQPLRGSYRGIVELHAPVEKIIAAGLQHLKKSSLNLLAG